MTRPVTTNPADLVSPSKARSQSIDILRAVAVFLVFGRHAPPCPAGTNPLVVHFFGYWHQGGWMGVDIFFVLSGFLVSGLLYREFEKRGTISGTQFLVRRGFRIYPPYWVFLFGAMAIEAVRGHYPPLAQALSECFFLQDYFPSLWGHTWSLAVEEQFYLSLILLFLYLVKGRKAAHPFDAIPWIFLGILFVCLGMRLATSYLFPFSDDLNYKPFHLRLDALFCGVFLAYLDHRFPVHFRAWAKRWRGPLIVGGMLLLLPGFLLPVKAFFVHTYGFTLFLIAAGMLLTGLLTLSLPHWSLFTCLAYVGENSYSIYLYHMVLSGACVALVKQNTFGQQHFWLIFAVYFFGSILVGIFMARIIEFPMLKIRDRLFPGRIRSLSA